MMINNVTKRTASKKFRNILDSNMENDKNVTFVTKFEKKCDKNVKIKISNCYSFIIKPFSTVLKSQKYSRVTFLSSVKISQQNMHYNFKRYYVFYHFGKISSCYIFIILLSLTLGANIFGLTYYLKPNLDKNKKSSIYN